MSAESAPAFYKLESIQRHFQRASAHLGREILDNFEIGVASFLTEDQPVIESPLEGIFWIWWTALSLCDPYGSERFELVPQFKVERNDYTYRLDFAVNLQDTYLVAEANRLGLFWKRIAIELDGHEFHERTVEQVIVRDQRDRNLHAADWEIFHFSGTELHQQPVACVRQVLECSDKAWMEFTVELRHLKRRHNPGAIV